MLYISYCQTQKMGFLWIGMVMQWKCYHISKSISAPKYTNVNAKLCSSMWLNYSSFYNNIHKLGTWRWGQWPKGKWGFSCGDQGQLRASCRRGSHSQSPPRPMGAAFTWGSAAGPGQSCSPTTSQPCLSLAMGHTSRPPGAARCPGWGQRDGTFMGKDGHCLSCHHPWLPASLADPWQ